jgi:hypothetical protein
MTPQKPCVGRTSVGQRDWYLLAEQPAPAPHLALPGGCAALRIVLVIVPCVRRSCEHFPDGFDLYLLHHGRSAVERLGKIQASQGQKLALA